MDLFTWIIVIFALVFVLCIVAGIRGRERRASFRIGGTTIRTGRGRTDGAAVADGIRKIRESVKPTSRVDTLETRLGLMRDAYAEYRHKMKESEREESLAQIRIVEGYLESRRREQSEREDRKKAIEEERLLERHEKREAEQAELRRAAPPYKASPAFREKQRRLVTKALRYQVLQRDGFRCVLCGASAADGVRLHVDHVVPVSRGGKTEMGNLRTLCEACNLGKGARLETPSPSALSRTSAPLTPSAPAAAPESTLPAAASPAPFAPDTAPPPVVPDAPDAGAGQEAPGCAAVSGTMTSGVPVYDISPRRTEEADADLPAVSCFDEKPDKG